MSNYLIRIDTGTTATDSTIGLLDGVYNWAIGDEEGVFVTDVVTDNGVSALKRSIDMRTGGGNSQDTRVGVELMGGKYALIQNNADIVGKRIKVIAITWNGSSYDEEDKHTGVITSVDMIGYKSVVNIYLEARNREVDLPYSSGAIGDVAVDGTVSGIKEYFMLNGFKVFVQGVSSLLVVGNVELVVDGATAQNVANMGNLYSEMLAKADTSNLYYEGTEGTYKIQSFLVVASGIELVLTPYNYYGDVRDEVGEVGTIFWSDEVYNSGVDGQIVVERDGTDITIDDVNASVLSYKDGSIIDAGDGNVWKSMEYGVVSGEFNVVDDLTGGNTAMLEAGWSFDGTGAFYRIGGQAPTSIKTGAATDIVDKTSATTYELDTTNTTGFKNRGIGFGVQFVMTGYLFNADKLYCVVDFDGDTIDGSDTRIEVGVTGHVGTSTSSPHYKEVFSNTSVVASSPSHYTFLPAEYTPAVTSSSVFDFYHPTANDTREDGLKGLVIDITGALDPQGGSLFYDDLRIFVSVGVAVIAGTFGENHNVTIKQINLIEGYEVGREGLKNNKVEVNNAAINGTIPLAYTDVIKRQNLFGINSTPPADGWGTEQVQTDGDGNLLSDDYIMQNIPTGALSGALGETTTTKLKAEIARSVPAVSGFNKEGVEILIPIGSFSDNLNIISYSDIKGELKLKAYEGRDIQPSLQFTFGVDKKRLQINNVEAGFYDPVNVIDEVGLSDTQKYDLWYAGHRLYEAYGLNTSQSVKSYPIVDDADGANRIATALYGNMGYKVGRVFPRMVATFDTKKSVSYDIGTEITINTTQLTGIGIVSSYSEPPYGGVNSYVCDVIDTFIPTDISDILQTGSQIDDVLQTGTQTDDILQQGIL